MIRNNNIPPHWKLVSLVNDLQFIKTGVLEFKGKKNIIRLEVLKMTKSLQKASMNLKTSLQEQIEKLNLEMFFRQE